MTTEREAVSTLIRWCSVGDIWQDDEKGRVQCNGCDPIHYLRRRRMLVCSVCRMAMKTRKGFDEHECYEAY